MSERLPVPPEFQHLIEKREEEEQRQKKRRDEADRRDAEVGPLGALENGGDLEDVPDADRRDEAGRREPGADRRQEPRRRDDQA